MTETEIYEFIAKYQDHINNNNVVPEELSCRICKYILIDPHQAPCGCEFCKSCISNYLNEEDKSCPGSGQQCSTRLINFSSNVESIGNTNDKIKRFIIKCINVDCEESYSIEDIIEHIKCCDYQFENCPFFKIGCKSNQMLKKDLDNHLSSQILNHSNLIMSSMTLFQQENECTQNQLLNSMNILNELQNNEKDINKITENQHFNEEKIIELENLVRDINLDNDRMKDKFQFQAQNLETLESKVTQLTTEIQELKNERTQLKNEIKKFTKNLNKPQSHTQSSLPFPEEPCTSNHDLHSNELTMTQSSRTSDISQWTCKHCTYQNSKDSKACSICKIRRS